MISKSYFAMNGKISAELRLKLETNTSSGREKYSVQRMPIGEHSRIICT